MELLMEECLRCITFEHNVNERLNNYKFLPPRPCISTETLRPDGGYSQSSSHSVPNLNFEFGGPSNYRNFSSSSSSSIRPSRNVFNDQEDSLPDNPSQNYFTPLHSQPPFE